MLALSESQQVFVAIRKGGEGRGGEGGEKQGKEWWKEEGGRAEGQMHIFNFLLDVKMRTLAFHNWPKVKF